MVTHSPRRLTLALALAAALLGTGGVWAAAAPPAHPAAAPARAATTPATHSDLGGAARPAAHEPPAAPAAILYDQYDNDAGDDVVSQQFESTYALYDSQAADDFAVPVGQAWSVTEVDVVGTAPAAAPGQFNVYFYATSGALPGSPVYTATNASAVGGPVNYSITLPVPAVLVGGATYWVSVQARLDFASGQWFWENRGTIAGDAAGWRNPPDGFTTGCVDWRVKTSCLPSQTGGDQLFRLLGDVVAGPTPSATPTAPAATATPNGTPLPTETPCPITFSDVQPADYFYQPVQYLACHGVISGYADGTFRPYANTTRAQMVKIVVLGYGIPIATPTPTGGYTFADVPPDFPFFDVIETAAAHSIVSGYACGGPNEPCDPQSRPYFRPYVDVTRGQLSKIDVVAAGWDLQNPPDGSFADVLPGSAFYTFVETAACHGVISGYACGGPDEPCDPQNRPYFRQGNDATRGQISKIVYLSLNSPPSCATR